MYDETTIQPQFDPQDFPGHDAAPAPRPQNEDRRSKAPFVLAGCALFLLVVLVGTILAFAHGGSQVRTTEAASRSSLSSDTSAPTPTDPANDDNAVDGSEPADASTVATADDSAGAGNSTDAGGPPTTAPQTKTTTAPTTTPKPTPPKPAPAKPAVLSVTAPAVYACSEAPEFTDPRMETVRWTTTNAKSVSIAIDNPTGISYTGLPANGQMDLTAPCKGDTQTFYIIAIGNDGSTATKSVVTKGI